MTKHRGDFFYGDRMLFRPTVWTESAITIENQVDKLIEKGLVVKERQNAISTLSHISYFKFNKYIRAIAESDNDYSGHSFDDVVRYYSLDRMARTALLEALQS